MRGLINYKIIVIVLMFLFSNQLIIAENNHGNNKEENNKSEKFDPGTFIIHHVLDAYSWHIIGNIEIPLPIIIYNNNNKCIDVFLSNKLTGHGHETPSYKNYIIDHKTMSIASLNDNGIIDNNLTKNIYDFSITKNVLALFFSLLLMIFIFLQVAKSYINRKNKAPKGIQSLLEPIIIFIRDDIAKVAIGEKKHEKFLPYLLMIFFFIFINNLMGLIPFFPGGANLTGNITVTLALALFTFLITTFSGTKLYWGHIFNTPGVPWWLKLPIPLMPLVEFMGILIKPFVLMVRLFANITAGHIIALGFFSLIFIFGKNGTDVGAGVGASALSVTFTVFMTVLELLVAFIQAFVFTLLSALYFGSAVEEHHH